MRFFPSPTISPRSSGASSNWRHGRKRGSGDPAATILVVDGEVLVRHVISEYLRDCGYRVIEAADADEAILVLEQSRLRIDLVLADAQARGATNGFGLSRWIRTHRPGLHVLLAGSIKGAVDAAADLCGGDDSVPRPYDAQVVLDRIRWLLASRARHSG
jgi:DNA-binding response OmpR family regulator